MPQASNMPKVMDTETGMAIAETSATRKGSSSMVTRITATIAMPNSRKKSPMRSETTFG